LGATRLRPFVIIFCPWTVEVVRPMMARMSGGKGLCIKHGRTSPGICAGVSVRDRVHATNWLGLRFHKSRIGSHAVEIMGLAGGPGFEPAISGIGSTSLSYIFPVLMCEQR
jgi:hypothetical protein